MEIKITKTTLKRAKPSQDNLGFGNYFSDHMFVMDYNPENGWHNPQIIPYQNIPMDPAAMVLHYGQAVFEGMKAYASADGRTLLFRPRQNMERLNVSNDRLCIPPIDVDFCVDALKILANQERDWVPTAENTSLYLRPFIFATDPFLGVRPSNTYKFMVICSPCGAYYPEGLNPVNIYVEPKYVRAIKGGVGFAKTEANYAASLKAQQEAKEKGFSQVLWLDGKERKYIEEVGTMNVFFVINGEIITPVLEGSILPGITRMSAIELLRDKGYTVTERRLSIDEVYTAHKAGQLDEAFGTGTAAVISPIGGLSFNDEVISINNGEIGKITAETYDSLTGIQYGRLQDKFGWVVEV